MSARTDFAHRLRAEQSGFTLMELLVAASLLGLTITLVGTLMVSLVTTERTVTGVTAGTTNAQLAATSIDARISQSSSFQVTDVGADQMLVARVAGGAAALDWQCFAWYYSSAGEGSIRTVSAPDGSTIALPDATALDSWSSLITGVSPPAGGTVFTANGPQLSITFDVAAGTSPPVAIRLTTIRLSGVAEEATCF